MRDGTDDREYLFDKNVPGQVSRTDHSRQELRDQETPEPEPLFLDAQELHDTWQWGNQRRPVPPNLSDRHKVDLVHLKHRWIQFATLGERDWVWTNATIIQSSK